MDVLPNAQMYRHWVAVMLWFVVGWKGGGSASYFSGFMEPFQSSSFIVAVVSSIGRFTSSRKS